MVQADFMENMFALCFEKRELSIKYVILRSKATKDLPNK